MDAKGKRVCQVCGAALRDDSDSCPVCALRGVLGPETTALLDSSSELRFEHYQVLKNKDGKPFELGRGAMGITYKALDIHLQCPVALKIINARFLGDDSARRRFVREARAAASVRHQNVASVFHLGESGGNYFYAMEFVDGETLGKLIQRSGRLELDVALEVVAQVAAGLLAIEKQRLVHRDIKASNIMVNWDEERLENVKIIDLGLAKGVAEETISTAGGFLGTPGYASPEQFAGTGTDIRSDLYSLGITLWEMLSGKLPFNGSATELMYQHQHSPLPTEKLKSVPVPIVALLEVLLAKDPGERFQGPAQLQKALLKVRDAIAGGSSPNANDLRLSGDKKAHQLKRKPWKHSWGWVAIPALCLFAFPLGWFCFSAYRGSVFHYKGAEATTTEKSIAVLPFESLSSNKDDTYFADGVQGEILNNLAKIAQLKVISRTSVMQYRANEKRDLRQIATALGVTSVLEGTVRRDGNRVRVNTELIDARNDNTLWADSYDRDLNDIFLIQSEVAQAIAKKLSATLSPYEKRNIVARPTDNLEAYDLYLRAKNLISDSDLNWSSNTGNTLREVIELLERAVQLDPHFAHAYCQAAYVHDTLYINYDPTPKRRALGDAAAASALKLQPDLPEGHLAFAGHLYYVYRDYERSRVQLEIARRHLPNNSDALLLEGGMDRRQGNWEEAIQKFKEAASLDPRNPICFIHLAATHWMMRQYKACVQDYHRASELSPNSPLIKVYKASAIFGGTGDPTELRAAIAALPGSVVNSRDILLYQLSLAVVDRDWVQIEEIIGKLNGGEDGGTFGYAEAPVPLRCYLLMVSRFKGEQAPNNVAFATAREQLNERVQTSEGGLKARLCSQLGVVDALLGKRESAVAEAKYAIEMLPIF